MITETERLILYGIKHLIERERFTPEIREGLDGDIMKRIVDHVNPIQEEEPCCEMPDYALSKDGENKDEM